MNRLIVLAAALAFTACAPKADKKAATADDVQAAAAGHLKAGTTVCINELVGVRYTLEDALRDRELEPEGACMMADIQLEESGEPSSWVMRYQFVGDSKWAECKSGHQERVDFAEECINKMISDLGGT